MSSYLTHKLFLYGTLKRGFSNNYLLRDQRFLSVATTKSRYHLYDAGGFPAMVFGTANPVSVQGEVWEVTTQCLVRLDRYECLHKGLYTRAPVFMETPFEHDRVEGYLYLLPTEGLRPLGGEWRQEQS